MNNFILSAIAALAFSCAACAQTKVIQHTVEKGETVTRIAQKYKVTPADLYRLNPDAQVGLKPGTILLIPLGGVAKQAPSVIGQRHVVAAGETAYGLAKKFNVLLADLEKANPAMKQGLKTGDTIVIPATKDVLTAAKKEPKQAKTIRESPKTIFHTVGPKETKYGIAKQYGISVAELDAANPETKDGLQMGYRLKIISDESIRPKEQAPTTSEGRLATANVASVQGDDQLYTVKPRETLYGLTRRFGIAPSELLRLNPELKDGVREGMGLKLPKSVSVFSAEKQSTGLASTLNTSTRKSLVLLLPFNFSKIQGDTVNTVTSRLKTDKFLNMTLDFYSGALLAIDSAKTMGLNVEVKILDSQETKGASAVATLILNNGIKQADAVIGPFYQANVERTAELLSGSKVAVISPLSKETGKLYPNLLQTMTQAEYMKDATYGYMASKAANMVAVVDPKKISVKNYLAENQQSVKLAPFAGNSLSADGLKNLLQKGIKNFVVLETENTLMIKSAISILLAAQTEGYEVQLAITEPNETLDYEEIQVDNLAKLQLLYPSLIRDNDTPEALVFDKVYKEKNKVFPNRFAKRGFDVTFDTLLRLSQEKTFAETLETVASEGVENKFSYEKQPSGAFLNTGFYIVYYDTDLSVHTAN